MSTTAYLVAVIAPDKSWESKALHVKGVDIFSEPMPTIGATGAHALLYTSRSCATYEEAKLDVLRYVDQHLPWLKAHLAQRARGRA